MGTKESLGRGGVQFMTAGTGVRHSERNLSKNDPLRFIQMWIVPRKGGLKPNYGQQLGEDVQGRTNKLQHLVADVADSKADAPIQVNQDVNILVSELDSGKSVTYALKQGRAIYFVCLEGDVDVGGNKLTRHDAATITTGGETADLVISNSGDAKNHILLLEMKEQ
jgi:redox-sensitive bicupin YhaK (pirin superfamily)